MASLLSYRPPPLSRPRRIVRGLQSDKSKHSVGRLPFPAEACAPGLAHGVPKRLPAPTAPSPREGPRAAEDSAWSAPPRSGPFRGGRRGRVTVLFLAPHPHGHIKSWRFSGAFGGMGRSRGPLIRSARALGSTDLARSVRPSQTSRQECVVFVEFCRPRPCLSRGGTQERTCSPCGLALTTPFLREPRVCCGTRPRWSPTGWQGVGRELSARAGGGGEVRIAAGRLWGGRGKQRRPAWSPGQIRIMGRNSGKRFN